MRSLSYLTFALLVTLVLLLFVNVVMRYFLRMPIEWTEEAGQLLLIWVTFLGAAMAAGERRHMAMDALKRKLSASHRRRAEIAISLLITGCLAIIAYYGWNMTMFNAARHSESLRISYALFYAAIPVGAALYSIFELAYLLHNLFTPEREWALQDSSQTEGAA
jgi:TRAP-type C4-dicarboxylate transport system permease small subunit